MMVPSKQIPRAIARVLCNTVGIWSILAITASSYDQTEMLAMTAIIVLLIVVEAVIMFAAVQPVKPKKEEGGKARPFVIFSLIFAAIVFVHMAQRAYPPAKARIEIAEGVEYEATKRPFEHWSAFAGRIIRDAEAIEDKHESARNDSQR